jgi:WD40 repeat protein
MSRDQIHTLQLEPVRAIHRLAVLLLGLAVHSASAAQAAPPQPRPAVLIARLKGAGGLGSDFSPDRKLILTAGCVETRRTLRPDGHVESSEATYELRLWDATTFRPASGPQRLDNLQNARFVNGGKDVFTVTGADISLWDAGTLKPRFRVPVGGVHLASAVSPDASAIALCAVAEHGAPDQRRLEVYEVATGKCVHRLPKWCADYVAFSPDGFLLLATDAAVPHGHVVHVWNLRAGREQFDPLQVDFEMTPFFNRGPADFSPDG